MAETQSLLIPLSPFFLARAVRVPLEIAPAQALAALGLPPYRGIMVVHGGAAKMEAAFLDDVQRFADQCIAPFAQAHRILIVDGGTDVGVSSVMGLARQHVNGTYPLVGILPHGQALYPGGPPAAGERYALNGAHTHFILVEGDEFGTESDLMVGLLAAAGVPGLALVINGGEIVLREVQAHVARGSTLVTVRGSGRIADDLADPHSPVRESLAPGARLHVADLRSPEACTALFECLLLRPVEGDSSTR